MLLLHLLSFSILCFHLHFSKNYFCFNLFFDPLVVQKCIVYLSSICNFIFFFIVIHFQFHIFAVRKNTWYDVNLKFAKISLLANILISKKVLFVCTWEECIFFWWCWNEYLHIFGMSYWFIVLFKFYDFLLIFCLNNLSNVESDVFKFPTIVTLLYRKKKNQNFKIHGSKITRLQEKVDKFTII